MTAALKVKIFLGSGIGRHGVLVAAAGILIVLAACAQTRVTRVGGEARTIEPGHKPMPASKPARPILPLPQGDFYTVQAGDTVYGVAFRAGLNFHDLAVWNNISEPYTIRVGQRLRLRPSVVSTVRPVAVATPATANPAPARTTVAPGMPSASAAKPAATVAPAAAFSPVVASPGGSVGVAGGVGTPNAVAVTSTAKPVRIESSTPTPAGNLPPIPTSSPTIPASNAVTSIIPTPGSVVVTGTKPTEQNPASGISPHWHWPSPGPLIGRFVTGDQTQQGINIAGSAGQPVAAAAEGVVVYSGAGLVGYGELIIIKHSNEWLSAYAHNQRRLVAEGTEVKAGQTIAEMGRTGAVRDMLHFEIRRNGKPVDPLQWLPSR